MVLHCPGSMAYGVDGSPLAALSPTWPAPPAACTERKVRSAQNTSHRCCLQLMDRNPANHRHLHHSCTHLHLLCKLFHHHCLALGAAVKRDRDLRYSAGQKCGTITTLVQFSTIEGLERGSTIEQRKLRLHQADARHQLVCCCPHPRPGLHAPLGSEHTGAHLRPKRACMQHTRGATWLPVWLYLKGYKISLALLHPKVTRCHPARQRHTAAGAPTHLQPLRRGPRGKLRQLHFLLRLRLQGGSWAGRQHLHRAVGRLRRQLEAAARTRVANQPAGRMPRAALCCANTLCSCCAARRPGLGCCACAWPLTSRALLTAESLFS